MCWPAIPFTFVFITMKEFCLWGELKILTFVSTGMIIQSSYWSSESDQNVTESRIVQLICMLLPMSDLVV